MAKMQLPTLNARATVAQPTMPSQEGPSFVLPATADPVVVARDLSRDLSVEAGEGERIEGMTPKVITSPEQLVGAPRPAAPQPLAPRLVADEIAKLEELSRTMFEIRGVAVAAQTKAGENATQMQAALLGLQADLSRELRHVTATVAKLEGDHKVVDQFIADTNTYHSDLDDEVAMLRSRLDVVDTVLQKHGLPTTASVAAPAKPTLRLHPRRRLVHTAQLDGDAVVLHYNPRQGHDGSDNQEFQISKDNVRNVWSGYLVEVPAGYVADVFVDSDVITSLKGSGASEFVLKMVTRGATRNICSGNEICRLTLRRIEPVRLEVVQP